MPYPLNLILIVPVALFLAGEVWFEEWWRNWRRKVSVLAMTDVGSGRRYGRIAHINETPKNPICNAGSNPA